MNANSLDGRQAQPASELLFLPQPRRLEVVSDEGAPADAPLETILDAKLGPESFCFDSSGAHPVLRHGDAAARRYGEHLLAQLRRQSGARLPALRIHDAPDFPVRGYLLDISRDRVPTRAFLELLVERLALLRINHLQLYTEHTFAYREHEVVWRDASPLDGADLRWLDALCRARGIELCANQNCFGHMERWLAHAAYRARAETPGGWVSAGGRRYPARTLAPTEDNANFALALCRELLSHLTSRRINIGFDEPFELGRGASAAAVKKLGRGRVYLEHLQRMIKGLHSDGCDVLFWGDVLRHHPELIGELPHKQGTALAWHYEAPTSGEAPAALRRVLADLGVAFNPDDLRGFAPQVDTFARAGLPCWVCPGTSSWNSLIGRWPNARANLLDAARSGHARGATGYLITDWGDNGHLQPPAVSLPPLAYGAAVAWCCERNHDLALAPLLDAHIFDDASGTLGGALLRLGELATATGLSNMNGSPLFHALLGNEGLGRTGAADAERCTALIEELEHLHARLADAQPACEDGALLVRELQQATRLARHGAWRIAQSIGLPVPTPAALRDDLAQARSEQRHCWLERSRPGGLEDSLKRLRAADETD